MPLLLVAALVVVPLVEIYVLIQVGQTIGALPTVALLVAMSVLGAWLLRREGRRAWLAFRTALASGRVPAKEVADGGLVIFGGGLLLTPGFATDVFGLLCVLPPTRAVLRRGLTSLVARRLGVGGMVAGFGTDLLNDRSGPPRPPGRPARGSTVIDGEVLDEDPPPGR